MRMIFSLIVSVFFISCGQNSTTATTEKEAMADTVAVQSVIEEPLSYPALYTNWEIGSRENLNAVLSMYKDWDSKEVNKMETYFADTVVLEMPDGVRNAGKKEDVLKKMEKFRNEYTATSNQILNAISLHNPEKNSDYVRVMVYNKWTYNDNKKDSMLYYDIWRIKHGKINYMVSFQQSPSRLELKKLEKMSKKMK